MSLRCLRNLDSWAGLVDYEIFWKGTSLGT